MRHTTTTVPTASATDSLRMIIAVLVLCMTTISAGFFLFETETRSRETMEKSDLTMLEGRILRYFSSRLSELQSLSGVITGQYLTKLGPSAEVSTSTRAAIVNLVHQSVFRELSIVNLRGDVVQSYGIAGQTLLPVGTTFLASRWFIDVISTRRPQIGALIIEEPDTHFFILAVPIFDEKNTLQAVAITRDDASFFNDTVLNYKTSSGEAESVYATDETGRLVVTKDDDLVHQKKVVKDRQVVRDVLQSGQYISSEAVGCYVREDGAKVTASGQYILSALMAIFIEKPCSSKYALTKVLIGGGALYLLVQVYLLFYVRKRTLPVTE